MAPKKLPAMPQVQDEDLANSSPRSFGEESKTQVWVYGVNDHIELPTELPPDFVPTGAVALDFRALSKVVGTALHPAFKERKGPEKPIVRSRRPSLLNTAPVHVEEPELPKESPFLSVRSVLLDIPAMHLLSLLLPFARHLKVVCFSDCRLDGEMLRLLRAGLEGDCSVESLQIEWNPFELPLLSLEEMPGGSDDGSQDSAQPGPAAVELPAAEPTAPLESRSGHDELDVRERRRYLAQSYRHLRGFRDHLENCFKGLDNVWPRLLRDTDQDALLSPGDFHDTMVARLGISGPQIAEVFEALDGPDYAAGQGRISLRALSEALTGLPEENADPANDPVGLMLAPFMDGECVLESFSLRACAIGHRELGTLSAALSRCPWQLRCLNLWDNRVCDRGADMLGAALVTYRGLEYLGLGKNRITQAGMVSAVKPFQTEVLDEAMYRDMQEAKEPKADPKAKAKPKPKAKPEVRRPSVPVSRRESTAKGCRVFREALDTTEQLEEVPGEPPTWLLRRPCELRMLILTDNPISGTEVVEALQPHGPRGAELVLRGTPVGAALATKRPELIVSNVKPARSGIMAMPVAPPPGDGWILRVA